MSVYFSENRTNQLNIHIKHFKIVVDLSISDTNARIVLLVERDSWPVLFPVA